MDLDDLQQRLDKLVRDLSETCTVIAEICPDETVLDLTGRAHEKACEAAWELHQLRRNSR